MADPRWKLARALEAQGWTNADLDEIEGLFDAIHQQGLTIVDKSDTIVMSRDVAQWCYDQVKEVQHGYMHTIADALKRSLDQK